MNKERNMSRRDFFRTALVATAGTALAAIGTGCGTRLASIEEIRETATAKAKGKVRISTPAVKAEPTKRAINTVTATKVAEATSTTVPLAVAAGSSHGKSDLGQYLPLFCVEGAVVAGGFVLFLYKVFGHTKYRVKVSQPSPINPLSDNVSQQSGLQNSHQEFLSGRIELAPKSNDGLSHPIQLASSSGATNPSPVSRTGES